jgi:O-antigen ligase
MQKPFNVRSHAWILLWSLLLGGTSIRVVGKTPGLLYFDAVLVFWLIYQIAFNGFRPDSRGWIVRLGVFCLLVEILSTIANYHDMYRSIGAIKILATGLLIYTIARRVPPGILMMSAWGAAVGILLLMNYEQLRFEEFEGVAGMKDFVAISLGHSNTVASILLLVIPFPFAGIALFQGWKRFLSVICSLLMLAGLAVTMSRGALVALALATVLSVPLLWRAGFRWKQWAAAAATVTVLMFALPTDLLQTNAALIVYRWENPDLNRPELMQAAWRVFIENPVLGTGPGQLGYAIAQRFSVSDEYTRNMNGHNLVLDALAENGFFGGAALLVMVGLVLWRAWKAVRWDYNPLAIALWVAILAVVLHNMIEPSFESQHFQIVFWTVAAMVERQREGRPVRTVQGVKSGRATLGWPLRPSRQGA